MKTAPVLAIHAEVVECMLRVKDILTDEEVKSFFYEHMNADLNLDYVDYEVAIPEEIIDMAEKD